LVELVTDRQIKPAAIGGYGRRISISYDALAPLLILADIVIIVFASVVGGGVYQRVTGIPAQDLEVLLGIGLLSSLAYSLCARYVELYRLQLLIYGRRQYFRVAACIGFAILLLTVILFLLKVGSQVSRGSVVCFAATAVPLLIAWRVTLKAKLRKALAAGLIKGRRALLIVHDTEIAGLTKDLLLIGCGVEEAERVVLPRPAAEAPSETGIDTLAYAVEAARRPAIDEILLCVSWGHRNQLDRLLDRLRVVPLPVRILPDTFVRSLSTRDDVFGAFSPIEIQRAPLSRAEQFTKRLFDLAVAGLALIVLFPVMSIAAGVLLLAGGPVIFRQRRRGFNGRVFEIYKFRTMTVLEDGPSVRQAERGDSRVTMIGRVLRHTSIDELPQLFNVLKGQMSVVGPRPHAVAHDEEYAARIGNYAFRHHMKPGITGWAQVNGLRGGTPHLEQMQRRIEEDLWYVNNWCLSLDLVILVRTCFEFLRPRNAY
jgi:Undecaprenyl-phosphate glucose phosphotransferase